MMWIILLVVLAVLVIWFIATYNGFVSLKNKVEEAFSTMDVYLVKRYDLIPNLVETVKGYAAHEKETPFDEAPNGFTGMDLALTITYGLVREGVFTEADLIRLWATEPARVFNLPVNTFEPGAPADFFLFDPELEWQVTPETLYSKSHNTPWLGKSLKGRVSAHWIGGVKIV